MVFTWQTDTRWSHFAGDLPVGIHAQRYKGADVRKRGEIPILTGLQDRDDAASVRMQPRQELGGHTLAVYNHSRDLAISRVLFIPFQKCGDTHGQMLVAAMGRNARGDGRARRAVTGVPGNPGRCPDARSALAG